MEQMALRIAAWMKEAGSLTDDQEEIIVYSLIYIMLSAVGIAGILALSSLLRILLPGALCAAAAASLRLMSGGAHYSSPSRCALMSIITFPVLALAAVKLPGIAAPTVAGAALVFALLAVLIYAPVDNEARPIGAQRRPAFRRAALAVVIAWAAVICGTASPSHILAISAGLAWQALSLTPAGRHWYVAVNSVPLTRR